MINIEKFLDKFTKNVNSSENQKKVILEIIKKYTEINLSSKDIEIKNYILYITASPGVKNKLFIYKNVILEEISLIPNIKIVDIK